ncbi:MAG TPA: hypothetical protein VMR86_12560 [Myxococcota bacterium]|nr:hypothetical protein [Myxococcota bacterium]
MTRRLAAAAAALCLAACAGGALPPGGPPAAPPARRPPAAPPEAPARGYLATTPQGVELEFDAARGTYAVREKPDTWWLDGRFFRRAGGAWESSPKLDGPWQPCAPADLPAGLRAANLAR